MLTWSWLVTLRLMLMMNNLSLIFSELQIEWNFGSRMSSCYRSMTITARTGETETSNHNCQSDWCRTSPTGGADNTASDTKSETVECAMRQESEQFGGGDGGGQHGGRGGLTEQSVLSGGHPSLPSPRLLLTTATLLLSCARAGLKLTRLKTHCCSKVVVESAPIPLMMAN